MMKFINPRLALYIYDIDLKVGDYDKIKVGYNKDNISTHNIEYDEIGDAYFILDNEKHYLNDFRR